MEEHIFQAEIVEYGVDSHVIHEAWQIKADARSHTSAVFGLVGRLFLVKGVFGLF